MDRVNLFIYLAASLIGLFAGFIILGVLSVVINNFTAGSQDGPNFGVLGLILAIVYVIPINLIITVLQFVIFTKYLNQIIHSLLTVLMLGGAIGLVSGILCNLVFYRSSVSTFNVLFLTMSVTGMMQGLIIFAASALLVKHFNSDSFD